MKEKIKLERKKKTNIRELGALPQCLHDKHTPRRRTKPVKILYYISLKDLNYFVTKLCCKIYRKLF